MKTKSINLHIEWKKVLLLLVLFSLFSFIIDSIVLISVNGKLSQLESLFTSKYSYSAYSVKSLGQDEFLIYNAGISFSLIPESDISLNANVVMQSDTAKYSRVISWEAKDLEMNEIAVTEGLSQNYDLRPESKLYSKHNVDGTIREYIVKQILPDSIDVRISKNKSFSSGIIVMGYDPQYADNLSHKFLAFSNEDVEKFNDSSGNSMKDILYREDEIASVVRDSIPYVMMILASSIVIVLFFVTIVTKAVYHNFKRLAMLGYSKKALDGAYKINIYGICGVMVFTATAITSILLFIIKICSYNFILLGVTVVIKMIAIFFVAWTQRNHLWRK